MMAQVTSLAPGEFAHERDIFGFYYEDSELVGYQAHPSIPAPIAV